MKKYFLIISVILFFIVGCKDEKDTLMEKGVQQFEKGNFQSAVKIYDDIIKKEPHNVKAYYKRASAEACINNSYFKFLINLSGNSEFNKSNPPTFNNRPNPRKSVVLKPAFFKNNSDEIEAFDKAIEQNPNNAEFYLGRSMWYRFFGDEHAALSDLSKAISLKRDFSAAYFLRGQLRHSTHSINTAYPRAFFDYKRASQADPNNIESRIFLGMAYSGLNLYEKSLIEFNFVLSIDPNNNEALDTRAQIYALMGNIKAAIGDYEKLVKKHPENPYLLYMLASQENMAGYQKEALKNYIKARKYAWDKDFIKTIDRTIASVNREMNQ